MEALIEAYQLPHIGADLLLIDTLQSLPAFTTARRMSLCVFIGLCTDGVASVNINGWKRIVTHNQIVVVTDDSVVDTIKFSQDFDGVGIVLSYNMLQEITNEIKNITNIILLTHNHPIFDVRDRDKNDIVRLFRFLSEKVKEEHHRNTREVARQLILCMIYDITEIIDMSSDTHFSDERKTRTERLFVRFIRLLEENFKVHRQVSWYAEQLEVTPKYLSEAVLSVSRRGPNKWIDRYTCTEIRNQLRHTNKPLGELARELNFSSQSFFGRYFKTHVGMNPSEYRDDMEK